MSRSLEALDLKKALTKASEGGSLSEVKDVLLALQSFEMTEAIVKETKLGKALKDMKSKYDKMSADSATKPLSKLIMDILKMWTRMAKKGSASSAPESTRKKVVSTSISKSDGSQSSAMLIESVQPSSNLHTVDSNSSKISRSSAKDSASLYEVMTPATRKIVDALVKVLSIKPTNVDIKLDSNDILLLAVNIEEGVTKAFPCDADGKTTAYQAKVRTLLFNLKRNEMLRYRLVHVNRSNQIDDVKAVSVDQLLIMNADELASSDLITKRKVAEQQDVEGRRQDWTANNKDEMIKAAEAAGGLSFMNAKQEAYQGDGVLRIEEEVDDEIPEHLKD